MQADYWTQRWDESRTGWHREEVMPLLREHWHGLGVPNGARVLVPLCGKSLDMPWLAMHGHPVLGVELARAGIDAYLAEQAFTDVTPQPSDAGFVFKAGAVQLLLADIFEVPSQTLANCQAIYDRAALIALPPEMRKRYVQHVYGALPGGSIGLLITLEYPQAEKDDPPFSVQETEVRDLLEPHWDVQCIQRRDILKNEPSFAAEGVTALSTGVYALRKRRS